MKSILANDCKRIMSVVLLTVFLLPGLGFSLEEVRYGTGGWQMNLEAWESLPDDLKLILEWACNNHLCYCRQWSDYEDAEVLSMLIEEQGATIYNMTEEEVNRCKEIGLQIYEEEAAEDPVYGARAVELIKDYMRVLGYL